uniref:Uncharacterized protein isoform X2 n=1 Tax=Pogona vitticeps TaxID=103695 RepID=A0ABM5ESP7_9SAUR
MASRSAWRRRPQALALGFCPDAAGGSERGPGEASLAQRKRQASWLAGRRARSSGSGGDLPSAPSCAARAACLQQLERLAAKRGPAGGRAGAGGDPREDPDPQREPRLAGRQPRERECSGSHLPELPRAAPPKEASRACPRAPQPGREACERAPSKNLEMALAIGVIECKVLGRGKDKKYGKDSGVEPGEGALPSQLYEWMFLFHDTETNRRLKIEGKEVMGKVSPEPLEG